MPRMLSLLISTSWNPYKTQVPTQPLLLVYHPQITLFYSMYVLYPHSKVLAPRGQGLFQFYIPKSIALVVI